MTRSPEDTRLLASVRAALKEPFADPVFVRHVSMSRAAARAIERNLSTSKRGTVSLPAPGSVTPRPIGAPHPIRAAMSRHGATGCIKHDAPLTNTAPAILRQPTLARGCDGCPPAGASVAQVAEGHMSARMGSKGEFFISEHGDCNA